MSALGKKFSRAKDPDILLSIQLMAELDKDKYRCKAEVCRDLIARGASVNISDQEGQTPLMYAVIRAHAKIIPDLVKAGVKVNARDKEGQTALMLAALFGQEDVLRLLIKARANPRFRNSDGKNAQDVASEAGETYIVEILQDIAEKNAARKSFAAVRRLKNIDRMAHGGTKKPLESAPIPAFIKKPFIPGGSTP